MQHIDVFSTADGMDVYSFMPDGVAYHYPLEVRYDLESYLMPIVMTHQEAAEFLWGHTSFREDLVKYLEPKPDVLGQTRAMIEGKL